MQSPTMRFVPEVRAKATKSAPAWSDGMSGSAARTAGAANADEAAILITLANLAREERAGIVRKHDAEVIRSAGLSDATGNIALRRLVEKGLIRCERDSFGASGLSLRGAAEVLVNVVKSDDAPRPKARPARRMSSLTGL